MEQEGERRVKIFRFSSGKNILVFLFIKTISKLCLERSRPLNNAEKAQRSWSVLDTPNNREVVVKEKPNSHITKTFQFDRVFGAKSQQLEVYRAVVEPLIGQVLDNVQTYKRLIGILGIFIF